MLRRVVSGLLALLFFLLPAGVLLLIGQAGAQVLGDAPPGIPAEVGPLITLGIAILSALLVQPLTAIAKKLGRTTGPNTVLLSAGLSLLVAFGYAYAQARASGQDLSILSTLFIALVAFAKANGDYINRVFTNAKGNELAPASTVPVIVTPAPVAVGEVTPPADMKGPPSGLEPLDWDQVQVPGLDGPSTAARGLLSPKVTQAATAAIQSPVVEAIVRTALLAAGLPSTQAALLTVAARLLPVAPDLLDRDPHLSTDNLNRLSAEILDLKREYHA